MEPQTRRHMIITTTAGTIYATQFDGDPDSLHVYAVDRTSIESVLRGIELVGGAEGEDRTFTSADITTVIQDPTFKYRTTVSKTEFVQYLNYEVLNFLTYTGTEVLEELRR
jgi:hypothetical protein